MPIALAWRRNWDRVIPFFAFPKGVRKIIYTTNAIEALHAKLRRTVKIRGHFPTDDAATKLIYLVLRRRGRVANGPARMGRSKIPVRHHVRGTLHHAVKLNPPRTQKLRHSRQHPLLARRLPLRPAADHPEPDPLFTASLSAASRISRLPEVEGETTAKTKLKSYPIGFFHIDLAGTAEGRLHVRRH